MQAPQRGVGATLVGIRKGMSALRNDSFGDFGIALDVSTATAADSDRAVLENWLDAGDLVAR